MGNKQRRKAAKYTSMVDEEQFLVTANTRKDAKTEAASLVSSGANTHHVVSIQLVNKQTTIQCDQYLTIIKHMTPLIALHDTFPRYPALVDSR